MPTIVESPETSELLAELTTLQGREDPYPRYDRLREISPLVRAEDGTAAVVGVFADSVSAAEFRALAVADRAIGGQLAPAPVVRIGSDRGSAGRC